MKTAERIVNAAFRVFFRICFRLNLDALKQVPSSGPLILILNHPSRFEGPMLYVFLQPRRITGLAKKQLWKRRTVGWLMKLWGAVPVDLNGLDRLSMKRCFSVLDEGNFLLLAPEGVRTNNVSLHQGKSGVAYIAFKTKARVLPIVTLGFDTFSRNIRRLKRTPVQIIVGKPFEITLDAERLSPKIRQELTDEMMMRMAELMPESHWGYYQGRIPAFKFTRQTK